MLDELAEDGHFIDRFTLRDFGTLYAQRNDMNGINQTLKLCESEYPDEQSWVLLNCILHLAINDHTNHMKTLLPLLRSTTYVDRAFKNGIKTFIENGASAVLPTIFVAFGENIPKYANRLMIQMVHAEVSAKEIEQTWSKLNEIGITIPRHPDVYKACVRSQSMPLIEAILKHKYSNSMKMEEDIFKGPIKLAATRDSDYMYQTITHFCRQYGFKPTPLFVRNRILSEFEWKDNPTKALAKLQATGISKQSCVIGFASALLIDREIDAALKIVSANLIFFLDVKLITPRLIDAYVETEDTNNFISFLGCIRKSYEFMWFKCNSKDNKFVIKLRQDRFIREIVATVSKDERLKDHLREAFLAAMRKEFPQFAF